MAMLTVGWPEFQQQKMQRSGLARYFDHMLFPAHQSGQTSRQKSRSLGQLLELYPRIIYFEDQPDVVTHIHAEHGKHGRILPIRVNRSLESAIKYPNIIRHFDEVDIEKLFS